MPRQIVLRIACFVLFFRSAEFCAKDRKQSSYQQGGTSFLSASPVAIMLFHFTLSVAMQHCIFLNVEGISANDNIGESQKMRASHSSNLHTIPVIAAASFE